MVRIRRENVSKMRFFPANSTPCPTRSAFSHYSSPSYFLAAAPVAGSTDSQTGSRKRCIVPGAISFSWSAADSSTSDSRLCGNRGIISGGFPRRGRSATLRRFGRGPLLRVALPLTSPKSRRGPLRLRERRHLGARGSPETIPRRSRGDIWADLGRSLKGSPGSQTGNLERASVDLG